MCSLLLVGCGKKSGEVLEQSRFMDLSTNDKFKFSMKDDAGQWWVKIDSESAMTDGQRYPMYIVGHCLVWRLKQDK